MKTRPSETLIDRLVSAEHVAVLTGAGISAESGLATFRDPDGAWARVSPLDMATFDGFQRDPVAVQTWYAARSAAARSAEPNDGHRALAALESVVPSFTLVTQNIDGLHQRAGSTRVLELHGALRSTRCVACEAAGGPLVPGGDFPVCCTGCGHPVRPDVVWFGESLPPFVFEEAARAASRCDVFLSIGTSALVYPAADLPLQARQSGAYVAELNLEPSAIADAVDEVLFGAAGTVLPALYAAVELGLRRLDTPSPIDGRSDSAGRDEPRENHGPEPTSYPS